MSDTIKLVLRVEGEQEIEVDRAEYEAAKAAGKVDHYLDCDLSNLDGEKTVTEPDGREYSPFSEPHGPSADQPAPAANPALAGPWVAVLADAYGEVYADVEAGFAATNVVCDLARYPAFLKFLALRKVDYLDQLDNLEQTNPGARLLDNVDAKTIRDPDGISDEDFADAMTDEWASWLADARTAGVIR